MQGDSYRRRIVDDVLEQRLTDDPAILLTGPRASGKTTTALRRVPAVVRLDVPAEAAAFHSDADAALARLTGPALLDEWQAVPEVLAAVRRAVDADPTPGRFILTSSMHTNRAPSLWPGTGRIGRVPMVGLSQAELTADGARVDLIERLVHPGDHIARSDWRLPDYVDLAVRGGMPAVVLRGSNPTRWYADYLDQFIDHDVRETGSISEPDLLRRYVAALTENLARSPSNTTVLTAANVNAKTAARYDVILSEMGLLDLAPSWSTNGLDRLVKQPKIYITDTGVAAAALEADAEDVLADGRLFGRMIDAFVAAQIRPAVAALPRPRRIHHLRNRGGRHEIDLIVDLGRRRGVVAIEVKAAAEVTRHDARHLTWLRDALGENFASGIVLHTGPDGFELSDRIVAAPISLLW